MEAFHHPYFNVGRSRIQQEMFEEMERWIGSMDPEEAERVIQALTKVRLFFTIVAAELY